MTDKVTTLNPGVGGDSMDESEVLQSDGVTSAARPRVVIGGDAGFDTDTDVNDLVQPVATDPGANPVSLPTLPQGLVNDTVQSYLPGEMRPLSMNAEGRLRVTVVQATTYMDLFGDTGPIGTEPKDFIYASPSPWG